MPTYDCNCLLVLAFLGCKDRSWPTLGTLKNQVCSWQESWANTDGNVCSGECSWRHSASIQKTLDCRCWLFLLQKELPRCIEICYLVIYCHRFPFFKGFFSQTFLSELGVYKRYPIASPGYKNPFSTETAQYGLVSSYHLSIMGKMQEPLG